MLTGLAKQEHEDEIEGEENSGERRKCKGWQNERRDQQEKAKR